MAAASNDSGQGIEGKARRAKEAFRKPADWQKAAHPTPVFFHFVP